MSGRTGPGYPGRENPLRESIGCDPGRECDALAEAVLVPNRVAGVEPGADSPGQTEQLVSPRMKVVHCHEV